MPRTRRHERYTVRTADRVTGSWEGNSDASIAQARKTAYAQAYMLKGKGYEVRVTHEDLLAGESSTKAPSSVRPHALGKHRVSPCPKFVKSLDASPRVIATIRKDRVARAEYRYRRCDFGHIDSIVREKNRRALAARRGHVWALYRDGKTEFGVVCDAKDGRALMLLPEELP